MRIQLIARMPVQLPTLKHGSNQVADSQCITDYLAATYPAEMAVLEPKEPQRCGRLASARMRRYPRSSPVAA